MESGRGGETALVLAQTLEPPNYFDFARCVRVVLRIRFGLAQQRLDDLEPLVLK